jgi:hypothetical protein
MSPSRTALLMAALGALMLTGCGGTTSYAVLSSRTPSDDGRCFDDCRRLRSNGTKRYVACMRACPGAEVFADAQCVNMSFDEHQFACTTEEHFAFSVLEVVAGIVVGVIAFGVIYFYKFYIS